MIQTDILIIGAGPVGLFSVFEAGLLNMRCHLIDTLPKPGGQLAEIYPEKPIYDIPGFPSILAKELVHNLIEQIDAFKPGFTLGEQAIEIDRDSEGQFLVTTDKGTIHRAPVICIAGGLGSFEPRKPPINNITRYENCGVDYIVRDPFKYNNKRIVIAGGGDSALDWTIELSGIASQTKIVHRRSSFRGAPDSVDKLRKLSANGDVEMITESQVVELHGDEKLEAISVRHNNGNEKIIPTDYFIPLFGMVPKLGPIADWGLQIEKNAIRVNTKDYSTNVPGIYAVGDINTYPGKLKLILCGFHEATLMANSAYSIVHPDKHKSFKYTTVTGVPGFVSQEQ